MTTLKVKVIKGYLTKKMDLLSQNDPYIVLQIGQQSYTTQVKVDESNPQWNQTFMISPEPATTFLQIKAYDEDNLSSQLIGKAVVDLRQYYYINQPVSKFISIRNSQKPAGKILLKFMPGTYNQTKHSQPLVFSNPDIHFYDETKHHKCQIDLQRQGNIKLQSQGQWVTQDYQAYNYSNLHPSYKTQAPLQLSYSNPSDNYLNRVRNLPITYSTANSNKTPQSHYLNGSASQQYLPQYSSPFPSQTYNFIVPDNSTTIRTLQPDTRPYYTNNVRYY